MRKKRLGLIQSRGLGDIVIALPIAGHYCDQGWDIYWPIVESFVPSMQAAAPWVHWIPLTPDREAKFFYEIPLQILTQQHACDQIFPLYQHLSGYDFAQAKYFQHTSFDQYKYIRAGLPFLKKWDLARYVSRNHERENALYQQLVQNPKYVAVHVQGSNHVATFDAKIIPPDWQTLYIQPYEGVLLFDWLGILERAQALILLDSVFANLVDQMGIGRNRHFIARSNVLLTPVLGQYWTWL